MNMVCPNCGKKKMLSRAVIGAVRHHPVTILCKNCGQSFQVDKDEISDIVMSKQIKAKVKKSDGKERVTVKQAKYNYRRSYGLCVICGNPSSNSAELCVECRKKKLVPEII